MSDPKKLQQVLEEISYATLALLKCWRYFSALFDSPDACRVLRERTPDLFDVFFATLGDRIILEISKLLGTDISTDKRVVSLKRAVMDLPEATADKAKLLEEWDKLHKQYNDFKSHRDQRISHTDEVIAFETIKLQGIAPQRVSEAIDAIVAFTNKIRSAAGMGARLYQQAFREVEQVETLLELLKLGNAALDRLENDPPKTERPR